MPIIHVFVHVKANYVEAFKQVSVMNAEGSMAEPRNSIKYVNVFPVDTPRG